MGNAPLECVFPQRSHASTSKNTVAEPAPTIKEEPQDPVSLMTAGLSVLQYDTCGSSTEINLFYSSPPRGLGRVFWCRLGERKKIREQSLRIRRITVVETLSPDVAPYISTEKYVGLLNGDQILHLEAISELKSALISGISLLQSQARPRKRKSGRNKGNGSRAFPLSARSRSLRNASPGCSLSGSLPSEEDEGDESGVVPFKRGRRKGAGLGDHFDDGFGTWWDDADSTTGDLDTQQFGQTFGSWGRDSGGEDGGAGFGGFFSGGGSSVGQFRRGDRGRGFEGLFGGGGFGGADDAFDGEFGDGGGAFGDSGGSGGSGGATDQSNNGSAIIDSNQEKKLEMNMITHEVVEATKPSAHMDLLASLEARRKANDKVDNEDFSSAPPPPPPPLEGGEGAPEPPAFDEDGVPMAPPPPGPPLMLEPIVKSKTKQFHWETTNVVQGSIWEEFAEEQAAFLQQQASSSAPSSCSFPATPLPNVESLETLFSNKPIQAKKKKTTEEGGNESKEIIRVIDKRRADNVEICLRRLKLDPEKVYTVLVDAAEGMDGDTIELLARCAPDTEEMKKVKNFKDKSLVGFTEQLFMALSAIPDSKPRFQALEFTRRFQVGLDAVYKSLGLLDEAANAIKQSPSLKTVLRVVLKVGNLMNQGTRKGNAGAFTLKSLLMLNNTKSHDGQTSLLDFVVQEVNRFMAPRKKHLKRSSHDSSSSEGDAEEGKKEQASSEKGLLLLSKVSDYAPTITEQDPLVMHTVTPTTTTLPSVPENVEDEPPPQFKSVFVGFEILADANHVQWEALDKEIQRLTRGVEGVKEHVEQLKQDLSIPGAERFCEVINKFVNIADPSIHELKQRREKVVKFFHRLHVYFGEEPPPPDCVKLEIMGLLHSFIITFQSAEMKAHEGAMRQWRLAKKAKTPAKTTNTSASFLVEGSNVVLRSSNLQQHQEQQPHNTEQLLASPEGPKFNLRPTGNFFRKVNESPLDEAMRAGKSLLRSPSVNTNKGVDDAALQASLSKFSLRKATKSSAQDAVQPPDNAIILNEETEHVCESGVISSIGAEMVESVHCIAEQTQFEEESKTVELTSAAENTCFGSMSAACSPASLLSASDVVSLSHNDGTPLASISSAICSFDPTSTSHVSDESSNSAMSAKDALRQLNESLQQLPNFSLVDLLSAQREQSSFDPGFDGNN